MSSPLNGVRVLELSRVLAGPWCAQNLADLGADVIKVERPGSGDDTRAWGPPYADNADGSPGDQSAYFLTANRGKKSITVNMATPEGQEIIRDLADASDIVIENFKVGALAKYGLDAASLTERNQKLIYCSITGFGQTGPDRNKPGYDFLIQGLGGLMSVTGPGDIEGGGKPYKAGAAVADLFTGMYATVAILAALNNRHATGRGDIIDMALLDCQVAMLGHQAMNFLTTRQPPARHGNGHPNIVPYDAFETADGHIIVAVGNDQQFAIFADVVGKPEWANDPRFASNAMRIENRVLLTSLINDVLRTTPSADWLKRFSEAGVPAGAINSIVAMFAEPQVVARNMALSLAHPSAGHVPSLASPIRFAHATTADPVAPPTLGQHTDDVLRSLLGRSAQDVAELRRRGVI